MEKVGKLMEILGKEMLGLLDIHDEKESADAHSAQGENEPKDGSKIFTIRIIPSTQGIRNERGIERGVWAEALIMVVSNQVRGLDFRVNPARDRGSSCPQTSI